MKKWILVFIAVVGFGVSAHAQAEKNALGLRLGDSDGFGTEISYQRYVSEKNRLEVDLGWRNSKNFDAFRLTALYHWVWNIDGGFNWYAGAGSGIAQVDFDNEAPGSDDSVTYFYLAGDIGIEYDFNIPILISLDFRPEFGFNDSLEDDIDFDIAFGVRYQF